MNYMTTTDLRTQSSRLVDALKKGESVSLIHRSQVIGLIKPAEKVKRFDVKKFRETIKGLNLPKTTYAQREKIYRKHLMGKYGEGIS